MSDLTDQDTGNLTKDVGDGISLITWNPQGKVKEVLKTGSEPDLEFRYDGMGQRIMKIVKPKDGGVLVDEDEWEYTIYVRDASGNVMAIYEKLGTDVTLEEQPIYGSSRVGMLKHSDDSENMRKLGYKRYELSNHLGNVNAVISDIRIGVDGDEWEYTIYVRDASGNVMAIYNKLDENVVLEEQPIYGSSSDGTAHGGKLVVE